MQRLILTYILLLSLLAVSAQPKYEVRAVWLTTIGGIDWPRNYAHDGMGVEAQKQQLTEMLDRLQAINVNTVLLQTRVRATTIYPSDIEPWDGCLSGKPGKSPGYDALQFAIDECHKRGMELHAWVVTIPVGKWNSYGCRLLRKKHPRMVMRIGEEGYMNPEASETAAYIADICEEITRRYDIDGIHLDYIRYPETWRGKKNRENITRIARAVFQRVKGLKYWVKNSCSPIGKYDDLSRYSSKGWNAYSRVAQDPQAWVREGLMDQLYPMMYFSGNNFHPFVLDWQEERYGRTIVAGLGTYMLHPRERDWPLEEMIRQLNVTRQIGVGHCHFRAKFLLDNVKGIYDYMRWFDRYPALVPPMPWGTKAPTAPLTLRVRRSQNGDELSWSGAKDLSEGDYLLYNIYASTDYPVDISKAENLIATRRRATELSIRRTPGKRQLHYAVTAMNRFGDESQPILSENPTAGQSQIALRLMKHDGQTLQVPQRNLFDADLIVVCDMQGRQVLTSINRPAISIFQLPDGMYQLKSLNRKGVQHRLGTFVIKRKQNTSHGKSHIGY